MKTKLMWLSVLIAGLIAVAPQAQAAWENASRTIEPFEGEVALDQIGNAGWMAIAQWRPDVEQWADGTTDQTPVVPAVVAQSGTFMVLNINHHNYDTDGAQWIATTGPHFLNASFTWDGGAATFADALNDGGYRLSANGIIAPNAVPRLYYNVVVTPVAVGIEHTVRAWVRVQDQNFWTRLDNNNFGTVDNFLQGTNLVTIKFTPTTMDTIQVRFAAQPGGGASDYEFGVGAVALSVDFDAFNFYLPFNPVPSNNETVTLEQVLAWEQNAVVAGKGVTYDVWFGTDPNEFIQNSDFELKKTTTDEPSDFFYAPVGLDYATTYYWRVYAIEPNDVAPSVPTVHTGPLWQFDTYLTADSVSIPLDVVQNANPRTANRDWNYSALNSIWLHRDEGHKGYLQWDATFLGDVERVEGVTVQWRQGAQNGILGFYAIIEPGGTDTWWMGTSNGALEEGAITWNNAPGNNFPEGSKDPTFAARSGEQVVFLGSFNSYDFGKTPATGDWMTLAIEKGSAEEVLLLNALNTGDRKLTIGVAIMPVSVWAQVTIGSFQDGDGGIAPARLELQGTLSPYIPINFTPANSATVVSINPQLSWGQEDQVAEESISYGVYFGTAPGTLALLCTVAVPPFSCDVSAELGVDLNYNTDYYWQVIATAQGTAYEGPVLTFKTERAEAEVIVSPQSQTVPLGSTVDLSVTANKATTYQWFKDGDPVDGANDATLTITNVQVADEGFYFCQVNNDIGTPDDSDTARLLTQRLMGWWKLDNNDPNDSIVDLYPAATRFGGQSTGDPNYLVGIDGDAIQFTAKADEIVNMPGSSAYYNFYPQGYTVSAWVKAPAAGSWGSFVSKVYTGGGTASTHYGFALFNNAAGNAVFTQRRSFGDLQTSYQICDNAWHLVTATWNPSDGRGRIYVDGIQRNQSGIQGGLPPLPPAGQVADLRIGADGTLTEGALNSPFIGLVDDVRIYSYPLNAREVAFLYNSFDICQAIPDFDVSGPDGVPDCKVDIYDLAEFAAAWLNPYLMDDFADLASEWLESGLFN